MAAKRVRYNFQSGTITDNPLTNSATTMNSAELANLAVVTSGTDYIVVVLDPEGTGNGPEVVYLTAHSSSATSATIDRAEEGTTGVEHAAGTTWIHAPVASDFTPSMIVPFVQQTGVWTWMNLPAVAAELNGPRLRAAAELTHYHQARVHVVRAGGSVFAGTKIAIQYSTDQSSWAYLDATSGPFVDVSTTTNMVTGAWVDLDSGAKTDVFLRFVGLDGNGSSDPDFGNIMAEFR